MKGFSLIEIIIVIIIIGVLASISIPIYQKTVIKAKLTEELILLDAFKKAIVVYRLNHDGSAPIGADVGWVNPTPAQLAELAIDIPTSKYEYWWTSVSDISGSRDSTYGMNISVNNLAFYCVPNPSDHYVLPHTCLSEKGKRSYCISGDYSQHANWVFE